MIKYYFTPKYALLFSKEANPSLAYLLGNRSINWSLLAIANNTQPCRVLYRALQVNFLPSPSVLRTRPDNYLENLHPDDSSPPPQQHAPDDYTQTSFRPHVIHTFNSSEFSEGSRLGSIFVNANCPSKLSGDGGGGVVRGTSHWHYWCFVACRTDRPTSELWF